MNLQAITSAYIGAINPSLRVLVYPSKGYTTGPDGSRLPNYDLPYECLAQVQSLTFSDIMQVNGLSITGQRRAIYLSRDVDSIERPLNRGGDLIQIRNPVPGFGAGTTWLVAQVLENFREPGGWVKLAVTEQVDAPALPQITTPPELIVSPSPPPPPSPPPSSGTFILGTSELGGPDVLGPT